MDADERYERLAECLAELRDESERVAILVEGVRDERALRDLGVEGRIEHFHAGRPIVDVAEDLARRHRRLIVLLDWDRTGGHLVRRLTEQLGAQVDLDLSFRKELAIVSQVRSVEDVPSALREWRRRAAARRGRRDVDEA